MVSGKYRFKINQDWWERTIIGCSSVDSFMESQDSNIPEIIREFFSIPQIQKWVKEENWKDIFSEWQGETDIPLSETGLDGKKYRMRVCDVLGLFLALLGIDFMDKLDDRFIKNYFYEANVEDRE